MKITLAGIVAFLALGTTARAVEVEWLTRYDGAGGTQDIALAMQLDAAGNAYVAGYSYGAADDDFVRLVKLSPAGAVLWDRSYDGGFGWDDARDLAVAPDGTVTIAGFTATSDAAGQDALVMRWDTDGVLQWMTTWSGPGRDDGKAVALDAAGNAYVGVESDGPDLSRDYVVLKVDPAGNVLWSDRYAGASAWSDSVTDITATPGGIATVTGVARGAESFDFVTIQYEADGTRRWIDSYNPRGNFYEAGIAIDVAADGTTFATGVELTESGNESMVLIRYDLAGSRAWVRTFDDDLATYDQAHDVAVGSNGTVAISGCSEVSINDPDVATVAFDVAGNLLWSDTYSGPRIRGDDCGHAIDVAEDGSVAVAGVSLGQGAGIPIDYVTLRYSATGERQWVERYDGPTSEIDEATAVAFAANGDVIVSGVSRDSGNADAAVIRYSGTDGGPGGCAAVAGESAGSSSPAAWLVMGWIVCRRSSRLRRR